MIWIALLILVLAYPDRTVKTPESARRDRCRRWRADRLRQLGARENGVYLQVVGDYMSQVPGALTGSRYWYRLTATCADRTP